MKKITSKQIFTSVLLIGIVALVALYFLKYKKDMEYVDLKKASNATLDMRVKALEQYHIDEPTYLAEMGPIKAEIDEYLEPYASNVTDLDLIMQAVAVQQVSPIEYTAIDLGSKNVMKAIGSDVVQNAAIEKYQEQITFVEQTCSLPNKITYDGLKTAVQSLFDSDYLIGIRSITYTKAGDQGELQGKIDLSYYYVTGTGKEYVKPVLPEYISGTENIFGVAKDEEEEE
ncbi:MAG: hypothetical protein IKK33_12185 [Lachnospiraceae bacterium]|nr:hypothetical protein [Lachnospiraceae bacterium]